MRTSMFVMAAMLVALWTAPARATLVYMGEVKNFTGAGIYTLGISATSTGGDLLSGYNLFLDFAPVGIVGAPTLTGVAPLTVQPSVTPGGGDKYLFGAITTNDAASLSIADGETATIAQITFEATTPGVIAWDPNGTFGFGPPLGGTFIPVTFSNTSPALVAAVPEPSTVATLAIGLGAVGYRYRRKLRKTK